MRLRLDFCIGQAITLSAYGDLRAYYANCA